MIQMWKTEEKDKKPKKMGKTWSKWFNSAFLPPDKPKKPTL